MLVIKNSSDVGALRRCKFRLRQTLALGPSVLRDEKLTSLESVINRYRSDCGCKMGAGFLIASAITQSVLAIVHLPKTPAEIFKVLFFLVASAIIAALIGKGIGIWWARWKYFQCLNKLFLTLRENEEPERRKGSPCREAG